MKKNELAINVFKEFVEDNGRMPTYKEFMELGYCKSHYYNTKKIFLEQEAKRAIEDTLRKQSIIGKI